jgi:hypothetical protein
MIKAYLCCADTQYDNRFTLYNQWEIETYVLVKDS